MFVYLLPLWRGRDHPPLRNHCYRISPFRLRYYCATCETLYYWKTSCFSELTSFCSCLPASVWHRISVVTFPGFFIESEQNFREAIAWECWETVPDSPVWHYGAGIKRVVSWHAMFKFSQKQGSEFRFNNFMLVSPFPFPVEKCLSTCSRSWQHMFGSLLVPGTPRRCVGHKTSFYPAFLVLWLSPYLGRLDKESLTVLLWSHSNCQRPESALQVLEDCLNYYQTSERNEGNCRKGRGKENVQIR